MPPEVAEVNIDTLMLLWGTRLYELNAAKQYCARSNAKLAFIEDETLATEVTNNIAHDDACYSQIVHFLSTEPWLVQMIIDFNYRATKKCSESADNNYFCVERNVTFAHNVEKLNGVVLGITGLNHLYGPTPTLLNLLAKHGPIPICLSDVDKW